MNDPTTLRLDEPLTEQQFSDILQWYEEEVTGPQHAAAHDCRVVRALRELKRLRETKTQTYQMINSLRVEIERELDRTVRNDNLHYSQVFMNFAARIDQLLLVASKP